MANNTKRDVSSRQERKDRGVLQWEALFPSFFFSLPSLRRCKSCIKALPSTKQSYFSILVATRENEGGGFLACSTRLYWRRALLHLFVYSIPWRATWIIGDPKIKRHRSITLTSFFFFASPVVFKSSMTRWATQLSLFSSLFFFFFTFKISVTHFFPFSFFSSYVSVMSVLEKKKKLLKELCYFWILFTYLLFFFLMRGGRKKKNATAEKGVTNTANWLLLGAFSPHHFCFFSLEKKKKERRTAPVVCWGRPLK